MKTNHYCIRSNKYYDSSKPFSINGLIHSKNFYYLSLVNQVGITEKFYDFSDCQLIVTNKDGFDIIDSILLKRVTL